MRSEVKRFLQDPNRGRPKSSPFSVTTPNEQDRSYVDLERHAEVVTLEAASGRTGERKSLYTPEKMVDVVLSDMSAPWEQTTGFWKRSLSNPHRMMNTTGINFKDHAGSMVCQLSSNSAIACVDN